MKQGARILARIEEILAGSILAAMSLATFVNVVARYIFNHPIDWAEEFSRYAFIWLAFMAAVVATTHRKHIVIDILIIAMPKGARAVCRVLVDLIILALMAAMAYYGWTMTREATAMDQPTGRPMPKRQSMMMKIQRVMPASPRRRSRRAWMRGPAACGGR